MASLVCSCAGSCLIAQARAEVRTTKLYSSKGLLHFRIRSRDVWRSASRQSRNVRVQHQCANYETLSSVQEYREDEKLVVSRRVALLLAGLLLTSMSENVQAVGEDEPFSLEQYEDEKEGFTLLRPAAWNKAGEHEMDVRLCKRARLGLDV